MPAVSLCFSAQNTTPKPSCLFVQAVQVDCADLAPAMLQKLQAIAADLKLSNLTSRVADAQDLSFAGDNSFDAISFSLGLHFLPNKTKYARNPLLHLYLHCILSNRDLPPWTQTVARTRT